VGDLVEGVIWAETAQGWGVTLEVPVTVLLAVGLVRTGRVDQARIGKAADKEQNEEDSNRRAV
jgi:hypothetical protein